MKPYYEMCYTHLKDFRSITCKDVQRLTDTNCPHTVIKQLRDRGLLTNKPKDVKVNGKWFRVHFTPNDIGELI